VADWSRTDKWTPASAGGGSAGFSVESQATGELGHGKPQSVAQEVLGYLFAHEVGVAVPQTELGSCGGDTIAVSKMWGPRSMDVPTLNRVSPEHYNSDAFRQALRNASGLLAYHAWVGTGDLKDEHLMVRPGAGEGQYAIASIDFASAFGWQADEDVVPPGGPPALLANRDRQVMGAVVGLIEGVTDVRIGELVSSLPDPVLPLADKQRISTGLLARRARVRPVLAAAGWL
jgi:hypothetical protein